MPRASIKLALTQSLLSPNFRSKRIPSVKRSSPPKNCNVFQTKRLSSEIAFKCKERPRCQRLKALQLSLVNQLAGKPVGRLSHTGIGLIPSGQSKGPFLMAAACGELVPQHMSRAHDFSSKTKAKRTAPTLRSLRSHQKLRVSIERQFQWHV